MQSRLVDLWYAMRTTRLDDDVHAAYTKEAVDHWHAQLPRTLEMISPNLRKVTVSVAEAPAEVLEVLRTDSPLISLRLYSTVRIQAISTFDETIPGHPLNEGPPDEEYWPALFSFNLTQSFEIACIASHLSRPGGMLFDNAHSFIDGRPIEQARGLHPLDVARNDDELYNSWPTLGRPDLIDVAQWFRSISAFSPPVATTRLQRAFAAFTYLVRHRELESEGEVLFRAMQGLEAFYCDGIGDLRKQLSDKTQLWLGLKEDPSNLVGKLYDLRSKYVHGSATMPYAISIEDPEQHAPSAMKQFYGGVNFSTRLLLATLQKCVREDTRDIQWEFNYRTPKSRGDGGSDG